MVLPTGDTAGTTPAKAIALRTRDEVDAMNQAADRQMESFNRKVALAGTVEEVLPAYYKARAEDSKATRNAREVILSGFKEILGNPKVCEITPEMIANWREHLGSKGGRASSTKGVSRATNAAT